MTALVLFIATIILLGSLTAHIVVAIRETCNPYRGEICTVRVVP